MHRVQFTQNRFNSFLPDWKNLFTSLDQETALSRLKEFVEKVTIEHPGNAILINLESDYFHLANALKSMGFEGHYITNDLSTMELVLKNGSDIPPPFSASLVVRVILMNEKNEILGISDKGHPGAFMFPGGYVNPGELPLFAAVRETEEEVGVKIHHADLKPIAIMNRVKANQYGASFNVIYYITQIWSDTKLSIQDKELKSTFWAPIPKLIAEKKWADHVPSAVTLRLLEQINNQQEATVVMTDPNSRLKEGEKALEMTLDLFPNRIDIE